MKLDTLRELVGLIVVLGNLLVGLTVLIFHFTGGYTLDELIVTLAVLAPIFAAYSTWILRHFFGSRPDPSDVVVPKRRAVLGVLLVAAFVVVLETVTILKALNVGVTDFPSFLGVIGAIEALFGVSLVELLRGLFRGE